MVINGDVITLNKKEVEALIEKECRKRLNMSVSEFMEKRKSGKLPKSMAAYDIEMMLSIA